LGNCIDLIEAEDILGEAAQSGEDNRILRLRDASSRNVTSRMECDLFSMAQCLPLAELAQLAWMLRLER